MTKKLELDPNRTYKLAWDRRPHLRSVLYPTSYVFPTSLAQTKRLASKLRKKFGSDLRIVVHSKPIAPWTYEKALTEICELIAGKDNNG